MEKVLILRNKGKDVINVRAIRIGDTVKIVIDGVINGNKGEYAYNHLLWLITDEEENKLNDYLNTWLDITQRNNQRLVVP